MPRLSLVGLSWVLMMGGGGEYVKGIAVEGVSNPAITLSLNYNFFKKLQKHKALITKHKPLMIRVLLMIFLLKF